VPKNPITEARQKEWRQLTADQPTRFP